MSKTDELKAHIAKVQAREHALRLKYKAEVPSLKKRCRELQDECDALRAALRERMICRNSGNVGFPFVCNLCDWQAWREYEPERHAPGCLAALKP